MSGSLSEKVFLEVNGTTQGMFLRAAHPGSPVCSTFTEDCRSPSSGHHPTVIEELFTVAWWEQRGAGLSFSPRIPPETMTGDQFIEDTLVVAEYLRLRFGQDRIYLLGHSGGSFIGIQAVARAPELFRCYIGMAQMVDELRSERMAWEYMVERFRAQGDRKMVRRLQAAEVTVERGVPRRYLAVRDRAMHALGIGTTRQMRSVLTGVVLPSLRSPAYTCGPRS